MTSRRTRRGRAAASAATLALSLHLHDPLGRDDLDFLRRNTRFDEREIRAWYRNFKLDCPDGKLSKEKILAMYKRILNEDKEERVQGFVEQIFRIFDKDANGYIDFREFMLATDMTASGSPEEKLRWAFRMYDKDGNGQIDLAEMTDIVTTLHQMEGLSTASAARTASRIFSSLDLNNDGQLSVDEFVRGGLDDADLVRVLQAPNDQRRRPDQRPRPRGHKKREEHC